MAIARYDAPHELAGAHIRYSLEKSRELLYMYRA
jgi:hypothetical protein